MRSIQLGFLGGFQDRASEAAHEECELLVAQPMEPGMFGKPTLTSSLKQLGDQLLDNAALKAVMISKDDAGDIVSRLSKASRNRTR